ncbi:hypothetical protein [Chromobacterium vaccinii]|uniref:hypothetical protein n=1 Tax=Chromobacterium vaccinii TaxID=1108595 RepID=UPI0011847032|nr:hypothetical protein [Chromobacterium vaccinii]
MNMIRVLLSCALATIASSSWATSKLYNAEAAVILKNGSPCFYIPYEISSNPAVYSDGKGLQLSLFNTSQATPGYVWKTWFKQRPAKLPNTPESCIPYGTMSKDWKGMQPKALAMATSYQLEIGGELGTYGAFFCIQKDKAGASYIAKSDHKGTCSTAPLPIPSR